MKIEDVELDRDTSYMIIDTLQFYADPTTYFAVLLVPDEPAGAIMNDITKTDLGMKPGHFARHTLRILNM